MAVKKNVLITFDCELFQGVRSGTVENCMLIPTEKILKILSRHKTNAVFFIDMLYLCRLKEISATYPKAKSDFEKIEQQLVEIAEQGHYVFNHLHPHWIDAVYDAEINQWHLNDTSKYAFESLSEREQGYVFEISMKLLNDILSKAKRHAAADGYRAGGLYIQPFASFKNYFDKYNILYEFSVLKNATGKLDAGNIRFDFSGIGKNIYRFSNDITLEDKNGAYVQYAMDFVAIPLLTRLQNSLFYRLNSKKKNHQIHGDGISTSNKIHCTKKGGFVSTETFSVEMLNEVKLPLYIKKVEQENYLHLLSHPKLVSDYNLKVFDKLLKKLTTKSNIEFDFKNFEIAE